MTKEEVREYQKKWRKEHPDYHKEYFAEHYILIDKRKPLFQQLLKVFIKNFLKSKKGG